MQGAHLWLDGNLPYVASFDIKPPGVFAAFLLPILCLAAERRAWAHGRA
jgi:hypothetical protein